VAETCELKHPNLEEKKFDLRSCEMFEESIGQNTFRVMTQPVKFAGEHSREFPSLNKADDKAGDKAGDKADDKAGEYVLPGCRGKKQRELNAATLARGAIKTRTDSFSAADTCGQRAAYVVPAGHVFLMNDNRADSDDSRSWGPVPQKSVIGKITQVMWSEKERGVNWGRIAAWIK